MVQSAPLRILAVRHAPPVEEGFCRGQMEFPVRLSPDAAAVDIQRSLRAIKPDQVWSSPRSRCCLPAARLAARWRIPFAMDPALHELAYGEWEGQSWSALETNDGPRLTNWMEHWVSQAPPGGECALDLEQRVRRWYARLDPDRLHLLVGHAGVIRALRVVMRGMDWPTAMMEPVPYLVPEEL